MAGGVGQFGASSESESLTIAPDQRVTATDSVVDARRTQGGAGNVKIGKKGSLTINTTTGLSNDDLKNALAPLTNLQLAQSNFRPAEVQTAIDNATVDSIERNEADRAAVSAPSLQKKALLIVGAIVAAAILSVVVAAFKKRK
jgi:hypothetical protein